MATKFKFEDWNGEKGSFCHKKTYLRRSRGKREQRVCRTESSSVGQEHIIQWRKLHEDANVSKCLVCCFRESKLYSKSNGENEGKQGINNSENLCWLQCGKYTKLEAEK